MGVSDGVVHSLSEVEYVHRVLRVGQKAFTWEDVEMVMVSVSSVVSSRENKSHLCITVSC